jgi:hypothetical protein
MSETDEPHDCLETGEGFLPERAREYLKNPDEYENVASDVRHDIRRRRKIAQQQLQYLENNRELWELKDDASLLEEIDPNSWEKRDGEFLDSGTQHLHQPLPDAEAVDFVIHRDTLEAMEEVRTELSQFIVDKIVDGLSEEEIPDSYGTKEDLWEFLQDHRQELRTELDDHRTDDDIEYFWGNDYVTIDDIVRAALRLIPSEDDLTETDEESFTLLYGESLEPKFELLRRFEQGLDHTKLQRE